LTFSIKGIMWRSNRQIYSYCVLGQDIYWMLLPLSD